MNSQVTLKFILGPYLYDSRNMKRYPRRAMDPFALLVLSVRPEGQACLDMIHGCATWQAMWRNLILLTMSKFLFVVFNYLLGVTLEIGLDSEPRALL